MLGGLIMIVASTAIYLFSADFRRDEFYNLLKSRAIGTAKLVLDNYEFNINQILRAGTDYPARLPDEKILILNYAGDTIYSSDRYWELKDISSVTGQVKSNKDVFFRQDDFEVLGTLHTTSLQQFVVIGAAVDRNGLLLLKKMRTIMLVVCLVSLLLFCIAGWFYAGRALKPISDMINRVEEISITNLDLRVPEGNGNDEIGRLAVTFNRMLERLETAFAMQKSFIANASHELRTPLTSISGQIEVLMMKDRSLSEYKAALASVFEDIRALTDLSNKLLLIARTSAESPVKAVSKVRIDEILWQIKEETEKLNDDFHISILLDNLLNDSDQMTVMGDESLLKVAFSNLIENGCKYSHDHSVAIKVRYYDKYIEVILEDNGIGIPDADIEKIFEPFYRGANTSFIAGTGIGLSLADRIIRNHNGTIIISSRLGKGTSVTVKLRTHS